YLIIPIIVVVFFLYQSIVCHRYLLSFPTRRSSDLHGIGSLLQDARHSPVVLWGQFALGLGLLVFSWTPRFDPKRARQKSGPSRTDRKSTRLNSSHVSISYAVFCLKKKTNISDISRH